MRPKTKRSVSAENWYAASVGDATVLQAMLPSNSHSAREKAKQAGCGHAKRAIQDDCAHNAGQADMAGWPPMSCTCKVVLPESSDARANPLALLCAG